MLFVLLTKDDSMKLSLNYCLISDRLKICVPEICIISSTSKNLEIDRGDSLGIPNLLRNMLNLLLSSMRNILIKLYSLDRM